jgi:hypothetical protein
MTFPNTLQTEWKILGQKTEQVANSEAADVNTPALVWGDASDPVWTDSDCAQNPAKWPAEATDSIQTYKKVQSSVIGSKRLDTQASAVRLRFLVADTADDDGAVTIWTRDVNGAPMDSLILAPVQAGAADCQANACFAWPLRHLAFTSGGTQEIVVGDAITGATGAATAIVEHVCLTSGSWAAGTAAGVLYLSSISGTFQSENLNLGGITRDKLYFNSGGTQEIKVDDIVRGATSGARAKVLAFDSLSNSAWSSGTAAGVMSIDMITGTFTASENLDIDGKQTNIATLTTKIANGATIGGDVTDFFWADTITESTDNTRNGYKIKGSTNGIAEISFDVYGASYLYADADMDGGGGTAGTDMIILYKEL